MARIRMTSNERRAQAFARLEAAAAAGERCPSSMSSVAGYIPSCDISALAYAGKISVEVSTHNWRLVTILVGPHKGKSTAPNPLPRSSVYMTIDKSGRRGAGGRLMDGGPGRQQPSKPQLLPYAGRR